MTIHVQHGGEQEIISIDVLRDLVRQSLDALPRPLNRVLIIPPDHTRLNSMAGAITAMIYDLLKESAEIDIMPALGTHVPMTAAQLRMMFGENIPLERFLVHDWRNDVVLAGEIPASMIREWSGDRLDFSVKVEVNRILFDGYDRILSIGQVVPHEVVGMANYTKNIVVGVGGSDIINKSHFLGAVCNMETIMGRADTPVRRLLNTAVHQFLGELPIEYLLTVMEPDHEAGTIEMRGFFAGDDDDVFLQASELCQKVNLEILDHPLKKVVVYLDPEEFVSTWLGNKAIYRTRMAIADDGE